MYNSTLLSYTKIHQKQGGRADLPQLLIFIIQSFCTRFLLSCHIFRSRKISCPLTPHTAPLLRLFFASYRCHVACNLCRSGNTIFSVACYTIRHFSVKSLFAKKSRCSIQNILRILHHVAEKEGFEPSNPFTGYTISNRAPSTKLGDFSKLCLIAHSNM